MYNMVQLKSKNSGDPVLTVGKALEEMVKSVEGIAFGNMETLL